MQQLTEESPLQNLYWSSVVDFLKDHLQADEALIAPLAFKQKFSSAQSYNQNLKSVEDYDWVVVHKGAIAKVRSELLESTVKELIPVFANEVFVVFSRNPKLRSLPASDPHLSALAVKLKPPQETTNTVFRLKLRSFEFALQKRIPPAEEQNHSIFNQHPIARSPQAAPEPEALQQAVEQIEPHSIEAVESSNLDTSSDLADLVTETEAKEAKIDYASLSTEEIKELMEQRFSANEAYIMTCRWDGVRAEELNNAVMQRITTDGKRILEIGCGVGGSAPYIENCLEYIGTDLSETAIAQASQTYQHKSNFKFMYMNAEQLEFGDREFDIFVAKEVIEHVPNVAACLSEAFRVLKPGGKLVITSPNRDSLHLRMNRKLGYEDFKCSIDHVKEFTFAEASALIKKYGFVIDSTGGVFLTPYWGIPTVDSAVRAFTDNDPEIVEIMRDLGNRVGAEYAFCFIISAIKPE